MAPAMFVDLGWSFIGKRMYKFLPETDDGAVFLLSLWVHLLSLRLELPLSLCVFGNMQVSFLESLSPAYICLTDSLKFDS